MMNPVILHSWMDEGLCTQTDPDLFFPEHGDKPAAKQAKTICAQCPVAELCETYANEHKITDGIWGGRSYKARRARQLRNKRKDAA